MRVLATFGALVFLYLALIPAGLIYSTLDSACAGDGCETSLLSKIGLTALYAICLTAVLATAAMFAVHAARGEIQTQDRLVRVLALTAVVIAAALFVLFTIAFPLGGGVALLMAAVAYLLLRRRAAAGASEGGAGPPASNNGHDPSANGHNGTRPLRPPSL